MDETWPEDALPHWMVYIATADCDATPRRCRELGGIVWHPPDDIGPGRCAMPVAGPGRGRVSVVTLRQTS